MTAGGFLLDMCLSSWTCKGGECGGNGVSRAQEATYDAKITLLDVIRLSFLFG